MDLFEKPGVEYRKFNKGDYIIHQGEELDYLYYLVSGSCYRSTITEKGDEIIYGIKNSTQNSFDFVRSLLGVLILYSDGISQNHFIARSDCYCYKIPKKNFFEFIKDKPNILSQILYMAMEDLRKLAYSLQSRQEGKTANRLCKLLLDNSQYKLGKLTVQKELNNIKISQFLGVHKVTVSKILKALRKEAVINREKNIINILDEKKLTAYAKYEKDLKY